MSSLRAQIFGALVLLAVGPLAARAQCGHPADLKPLAGDSTLASRWIETGMDDGKPLHLWITDREGALKLRFEKTGEGLWAEGSGALCAVGAALEVRFAPGSLRAGPGAGWLLRQSLERGATFLLERAPGGELRVRTRGWHGRFAPAP